MGKLSDQFLISSDAYARNTDPQTSHSAATLMKRKLSNVETIVAKAVIRSGNSGLTCDEICYTTGLAWNVASPRLRPLQRKRIIRVKLDPETGKPLTRRAKSGKQQQILFKW